VDSISFAGRPLDAAAATSRAEQVTALSEPRRLRLLSILVSRPDVPHDYNSIADELEVTADQVAADIALLTKVGLVLDDHDGSASVIAAPDTWIRFGRLLIGPTAPADKAEPQPAESAMGDLPPVVQTIADRLAYRFSSHFSKETVGRYVAESYALLRERSKVTRHLPSLTSRFATERLSALATSQGSQLSETPEILFVCVHNAGRSQIAAGLLQQLAGSRVHVRTAGSEPSGFIDPQVVEVLDEIGVPVAAEFPKPLTDEVVQAADVVITMGCGDACPVYPGRRYLDWPIEDPVGRSLDEVRAIRDTINVKVVDLMASLGVSARE
jgi:protein-tyrosine-phosphatase